MSISGLALSRVSHQAVGAVQPAYVCLCAPMYSYAILLNLPPSLGITPALSPSHIHTHSLSLTRASLEGAGLWQVQAFWSRAILLSVSPALQP